MVAVNRSAEAAGVRPGLPLADARALVPGLATFEAAPARDRRALEALADWCGRYTPWTAVDNDPGGPGAGGIWLDISGCGHLFGGEAALLEDLVAHLDALGFRARAAAAETPGAAWAVARLAVGKGGAAVVPAGQAERALASLPVAGLRLPPATVEGLSRVGLRRIAELAALPRAPLAARFGEATVRRLDEALGQLQEPISPRRPVPPLRVRLAFAEPIARPEDIAAALRRLLAELCARLEKTHQGARRLELALYRADGTTTGAAIGTSRPAREASHLDRLFKEKLGTLDAGFGVEVMTLAATAVDSLPPTQIGLDADNGTRGNDARRVARLVDRLGNRLGPDRVVRLVARASHIPERACSAVSALASPAPPPDGTAGNRPPRPLYLLPWPEPIEVIAPVGDDAPVLFRWRRDQHLLTRADGPERIGPEWWLEEPQEVSSSQHRIRDYYRVEDTQGRRFWVYRDGPYLPGVRPRWYLHGVFA